MVRGRQKKRYDPVSIPLWFNVLNYFIMIILSLLFILPFWLMLIVSLTPESEIAARGFRLWADHFTLFAYEYLFASSNQFSNAFLVTLALTIVGTLNNLFFTSMGAYVLSKRRMPYRTALTIFIFIPMLFNGGLIPYFLVVKSLKMLDTFFALFIPGTISIWNMLIIRNFFMALPESLEESAILDGANDFSVYFRIILPLSKPILATMVVYTAVGFWNEWYNALIFITRNEYLTTLQLLLRKVLTNTTVTTSARGGVKVIQSGGLMPSESMKMAAVMIATLPIIVVYPFLQKYFTKGLLIGSIKG